MLDCQRGVVFVILFTARCLSFNARSLCRVYIRFRQIFDFGLSKAVVKDHKLVGEAGSLR